VYLGAKFNLYKDESYICCNAGKGLMPKKLRPAVDLMAFKCRTLKVKGYLLIRQWRLRWGFGVQNHTPATLPQAESNGCHCTGIWVVTEPVRTGVEKRN
jgi:hypothetical protein